MQPECTFNEMCILSLHPVTEAVQSGTSWTWDGAINSWHFPREVRKFLNWEFWTQTGFIAPFFKNIASHFTGRVDIDGFCL